MTKDAPAPFSVAEALRGIPDSSRGEITNNPVPWIYSNDHEFANIMEQIVEAGKKSIPTGKPRIAILSGTGSIFNVAAHMQADSIISVDLNRFVMDQVQRSVENIQRSTTLKDFHYAERKEKLFSEMRAQGVDPEPYWDMERESFGQWHFTSSESAYRAARKKMLATPVFYSQGNFTHKPYVESLGKALAPAEISYASFTDLAEWYPQFLDLVPLLGIADDAPIVWSTNNIEEKPIARVSIGTAAYIKDQREAMRGKKVTYFQKDIAL